jgi:hypothetical protein
MHETGEEVCSRALRVAAAAAVAECQRHWQQHWQQQQVCCCGLEAFDAQSESRRQQAPSP